MSLRTTGCLYALAIEPPGSIQREIVFYRRRLFAALGEASALALPDYLFLAFTEFPPSSRGAGLGSLWEGRGEAFTCRAPYLEAGTLYLAIEPPLVEFQAAASALLGPPARRPPIEPGRGLFLLRPAKNIRGGALTAAREAGPPPLSFHSAALLLLKLEFVEGELDALTWLELARAYRPRRVSPPESRGFL